MPESTSNKIAQEIATGQNNYPENTAVGPVWIPGEDSPDSPVAGSNQKDHEHTPEPNLRDLPLRIENFPRFLLLGLIRLYQATFSRTLPPDSCRFYPSCSHYGYQAIFKYGVIKGGAMAIWRVLRCNPFNKGGFDPVP